MRSKPQCTSRGLPRFVCHHFGHATRSIRKNIDGKSHGKFWEIRMESRLPILACYGDALWVIFGFLDIYFKTNHHNHPNFWFVCKDWDLNSLQPQVGYKTCPYKMALGTMALLFPCMHQRPRCTKFLVDFTRIIMSKRNYSHVHMLKK